MSIARNCFIILFLAILCSCSSSTLFISEEGRLHNLYVPPTDTNLVYQLYLVGDAGAASTDRQEPTLQLLQSQLEQSSERSAVVFLGDNIYPAGLPVETDPYRRKAEEILREQLDIVTNYPGRVVFIPGNHDWDNGNEGGLEAVKRQEEFIESYLDRGNTFLPDEGLAGPVDLKLMDDDDDARLKDDIRLIVLDTHWWLHRHTKGFGDDGEFELHDGGDFLAELDKILLERQKDFLVVAGHHPLRTQGPHGGYVSPSTHLKPPFFGSVYALYRRVFGFPQDLTHHRYGELSERLQKMFKLNDHLIYASGHSHSLQYFRDAGVRETQHYIVSGAGSKENYVAKGRGAEFTYEGKGFVRLNYYGDGSVWMEAWSPEEGSNNGQLVYKTELKPPYDDPLLNEDIQELPDFNYSDSTRTTAANATYDTKSPFFEFIAGDHNRKLWSIEQAFPYFDITEINGGLSAERFGGKAQSNTLHLEDSLGRKFVLRSVDKEAGRIWDEGLRKTFALDLAQDQFSILNPYGALIVPRLSDAVGIYHSNPKIYYVPNDPRLGIYADIVGGRLALFEEKPDGDMSHLQSVGYSEEVVSYRDMITEVNGDIDHRIDQEMFAKARLLDMLIGDWDRHFDQWRWATFEPEDRQGKIYRPIPRDRDVAFMKMTGVIPSIAKFGPFFQYQNFGEDYGYLKGLNFNSLGLTRRFTNALTKEDWLGYAEEMQSELTDEVIESAVAAMPEPVLEVVGKEITEGLKARRDKLRQVTEQYYGDLSSVVSIPGSNKRERFVIQALNDIEINIQVFKLSGDGELRESYYSRTIRKNETGEIRLFGLAGDDEFEFMGNQKFPVKVIINGGSGDDRYVDRSLNKIHHNRVEIFDTERGNEFELSRKTHQHLTDDATELYYNYEDDFVWDRRVIQSFFAYNGDDGPFIGGGPKFIRNGYRKFPAVSHFLAGNFAPKTGAANMEYIGNWYRRFGGWDLNLESSFFFPKSYKNFFGLGNETTLEERGSSYYRARLTRFSFDPSLSQQINRVFTIKWGNRLNITQIDPNRDEPNVVTEPGLGISPDTFEDQWFNTLYISMGIRDLNNASNPSQGYAFNVSGDLNIGLRNTSHLFSRISSELALFFPMAIEKHVVLANRTGGSHNVGDFPFYEANTIGGTTNLRGFRGNRFSGRSTFYTNTELRFELIDFYRYLLGGKLGMVAFHDIGRVWADGENSSLWHQGYGGGLWFNVFNSFMVNSEISFSDEGYLIEFGAGFFF